MDLKLSVSESDDPQLRQRLAALDHYLAALGSVLVAFSAGADSAFLLAAAVRALGPENVAAGTGVSGSLASGELAQAQNFAQALGVRLLTPSTRELDRPGYVANDKDRCFHCKAELLDVLLPLAAECGLAVVVTGTNADDAVAGFRPGIRAAADRGAKTPLLEAGFTKEQVRAASKLWGLPTWDKPAAACLSSRVAYGISITPARLARIDRAERAARDWLQERGFAVRDLRVRDLGSGRARLEVDEPTLRGIRSQQEQLCAVIQAVGFDRVALDQRAFRSGVLNLEPLASESPG